MDPYLRERVSIDPNTSCWNWQGAKNPQGYGRCWPYGKTGPIMSPHRYSYLVHKDGIPPNYHIDHLCRNPACCNPEHLEAVTPKENTMRGISPSSLNAKKTHCKQGHSFDAPNGYLRRGERGNLRRGCRMCDKTKNDRNNPKRYKKYRTLIQQPAP